MALAAQEKPALQQDYGLSDEEDLSEEQIQELLKQAEARLRERAVSKSRPQNATTSLPKLSTGTLEAPYVKVEKNIARVDGSRLLDPNLRALSNQVRKVEEPVRQKQKQAEVSCSISLPLFKSFTIDPETSLSTANEENFPYISRADTWFRLGYHPASMRVFLFIVTLRQQQACSAVIRFELRLEVGLAA